MIPSSRYSVARFRMLTSSRIPHTLMIMILSCWGLSVVSLLIKNEPVQQAFQNTFQYPLQSDGGSPVMSLKFPNDPLYPLGVSFRVAGLEYALGTIGIFRQHLVSGRFLQVGLAQVAVVCLIS